ncbi:MAG: acyl-CoA thioesterase [Desulfobulbaceae bacterium]|nr:MAG: acyl-CoA thioesterase [Desulfobulbaceae bacterium]
MADLPRQIHTSTIRVLYGDTDAGGVVYNANYLRYFEFGRTELMREWVCSYREIEAMGFILPVTETWSRFKSPAFYDDLLTISTQIAELTRFTCKFVYKISRNNPEATRPTLIAKGYTIHAAVTREGKLTRLPTEILDKLAAFAPSES